MEIWCGVAALPPLLRPLKSLGVSCTSLETNMSYFRATVIFYAAPALKTRIKVSIRLYSYSYSKKSVLAHLCVEVFLATGVFSQRIVKLKFILMKLFRKKQFLQQKDQINLLIIRNNRNFCLNIFHWKKWDTFLDAGHPCQWVPAGSISPFMISVHGYRWFWPWSIQPGNTMDPLFKTDPWPIDVRTSLNKRCSNVWH